MAANRPRAVFVTRETDYELLVARHATRDQARFFLQTRDQRLEDIEARHANFHALKSQCRIVGSSEHARCDAPEFATQGDSPRSA